MSEIGKELDLPTAQVVALYNKAMRKFSARLLEIQKEEIESESAETDAAVLRKAAQAEERAERGDQVRLFVNCPCFRSRCHIVVDSGLCEIGYAAVA